MAIDQAKSPSRTMAIDQAKRSAGTTAPVVAAAVVETVAKKPKLEEITKPDTHRRTYSFTQLRNGVKVVVASDPHCDKAGAAACMNVGMCHERKDLPGLAHFLEHMLFTGTKTYPDEKGYHEFIDQNGGRANAYTACYFTNFMFEVMPDKLEEALDRFGRFFSEPILSRDCTEREVNAVDSEFKMGQTDPWWRSIGIINMSANPEHPFHAACGNNKVLLEGPRAEGIDLYTEMRHLYDSSYSANGLTVCIIGKESNAELEAMANDKFGRVINKEVSMPIGDDHGGDKPPFLPKDWHQLLLQNPVKDVKEFTLTWVIPYQAPLWKTKPTFYVSHLLGYEGEGSVIAALKDLGLITSCCTFDGAWLQGAFTLFSLQCDLTEKGLSELKTIGTYFFAYIKMLQKEPVERWIWDELSNLQQVKFKLGEDMQPFDLAQLVSGALQRLPQSEVLAGDELLYEYDPEGIKSILDMLQLDTVRVSHQAKCLADRCTEKDTSYDSPMRFEPIPDEWLKEWGGDLDVGALGLALPMKNPFIPEDLSLKVAPAQPAPLPKRVHVGLVPSPIACLLYRQDDVFLQPKSAVSISIWAPYIMQSPETMLKTSMWCMCVEEELNAYAYDAEVAGLSYELGTSAGRICLSLSGFSDKLGVLLKTVAEKMRSFSHIPENVYGIIADSVEDQLNNVIFHSQPCQQAAYRFSDLAGRGNTYPFDAQYKAFKQLEREDFVGLPAKLFDACHVEVFMLGNTTPQDTAELGVILTEGLQLSEPLDVLPDRKEAVFMPGTTVWKVPSEDKDDPNHAVKMWMQFEVTDEHQVMLLIISSILGTKYFDLLRTQRQLGYMVNMNPLFSDKFCYLTCLVQTEFPTDYARSCIQDFFSEHFKWIQESLSDDEFDTCLEGVLVELKTKPANLDEEMMHWSRRFNDRTYDFGTRARLIDLLAKRTVTLKKLQTFVAEEMLSAPKLYIQVISLGPEHAALMSSGECGHVDTGDSSMDVTNTNSKGVAEKAAPANICGKSENNLEISSEEWVQTLRTVPQDKLDVEMERRLSKSIAIAERERSKPLPEGVTIPADSDHIRNWIGTKAGIQSLDTGTPCWVSWNGSKPDAWKAAAL